MWFVRRQVAIVAAFVSVTILLGFGPAAGSQSEKIIYNFQDQGDGSQPAFNLIADLHGNLYGTTEGDAGDPCRIPCGTVFELSPPSMLGAPWAFSVLHGFTDGPDGGIPHGNLIFGPDGTLFGTTARGGVNQYRARGGVVFEMRRSLGVRAQWAEIPLYSFGRANDGFAPQGGVVRDDDGNLYGTTALGGRYNDGIVYEISPPKLGGGPWKETILHEFAEGNDGDEPLASLAIDRHGNLYGTTEYGGAGCDCGIVFELSPPPKPRGPWAYNVIHTFAGTDGGNPQDQLVLDTDGRVYGTTLDGGAGSPISEGTVFRLSPPANHEQLWSETVLYNFPQHNLDAGYPAAGVIGDGDGNIYGTSSNGGLQLNGTVFRLSRPAHGPTWSETILYNFNAIGGGATYPFASLIFGKGGLLYGTTQYGGNGNCVYGSIKGCGTVFSIGP